MRYDGYEFRVSKKIVMLPNFDKNNELMPYVDVKQKHYVYFGKIVPRGKSVVGSVKTDYTWNDTGENVYAVPLKLNGHSLTNMAYGEDGKIYLAYDGKCFQAKR